MHQGAEEKLALYPYSFNLLNSLCAVFGGTYCLQHPAKALVVANERCVGVVSCGQRLVAEHIVIGIAQAPTQYLDGQLPSGISRGVFITNKCVLQTLLQI